jgi:hypothetical protein
MKRRGFMHRNICREIGVRSGVHPATEHFAKVNGLDIGDANDMVDHVFDLMERDGKQPSLGPVLEGLGQVMAFQRAGEELRKEREGHD